MRWAPALPMATTQTTAVIPTAMLSAVSAVRPLCRAMAWTAWATSRPAMTGLRAPIGSRGA